MAARVPMAPAAATGSALSRSHRVIPDPSASEPWCSMSLFHVTTGRTRRVPGAPGPDIACEEHKPRGLAQGLAMCGWRYSPARMISGREKRLDPEGRQDVGLDESWLSARVGAELGAFRGVRVGRSTGSSSFDEWRCASGLLPSDLAIEG